MPKTAFERAKFNHPHMSDGLLEIIAMESRIYASDMAVLMKNCKTVGELKQYVQYLVDDGIKAERELEAYRKNMQLFPKDKPIVSKKKGRK